MIQKVLLLWFECPDTYWLHDRKFREPIQVAQLYQYPQFKNDTAQTNKFFNWELNIRVLDTQDRKQKR